MPHPLSHHAKARRFLKVAALLGVFTLAGKIVAEETKDKEAAAADQPEYVKRGPYAGGEKKPAVCDNKLHLPILMPKAQYDLKEYCGGTIAVF